LLLAARQGLLVLDLRLTGLRGLGPGLVLVGRPRRLEPVDLAPAALAPAEGATVVGDLLAVEGQLPVARAERRARAQGAVGRGGGRATADHGGGLDAVLVALVVDDRQVVLLDAGQLDVLVGARADRDLVL